MFGQNNICIHHLDNDSDSIISSNLMEAKGEEASNKDNLTVLNKKRERNTEIVTKINKVLSLIEIQKRILSGIKTEIFTKMININVCIDVCENTLESQNEESENCGYCTLSLRNKNREIAWCHPCGHVYCYDCVNAANTMHNHFELMKGPDEQLIALKCPKCRSEIDSYGKLYI